MLPSVLDQCLTTVLCFVSLLLTLETIPVSLVICLDVRNIPLLLWWPGHALTKAEGSLTLRYINLCGGMCLMMW